MNEETSRKEIAIGNNKIIMKRVNPYGMVQISFEKGTAPEWLQGSYTSYEMAERDVERYLLAKKKAHIAQEIKQEA